MFLLLLYMIYLVITVSKLCESERIPEWIIIYYALGLCSILLNFKVKKSNPGFLGTPIVTNSRSLDDFACSLKAKFKSRENIRFTLPTYNEKYCSICRTFKNEHVYHCYNVGRCVEQFDHYCFILGNAIGKNNYKLFILAVLLINVLIFWTIFILYNWSSNIEFFAFSLLIPASFISVGMLGFHAYLKYSNQKTFNFLKRNKTF
eukprot:NODE_652_length_5520_cov_0.241284.p2 type:complete len:204 gc:universal NODE_652_length_5520_cov_0.241284:2811-2200(-)